MVYYRKYRPQTLDDLDKEDIRKRLLSLLSKKEISHAFLFTGSKGIGKTSTARIIAKIVNCTKRKTVEPCNTCENCRAIANGSHVDVIEIDAASNRGIDEIRELREKIVFAPAIGKMKVFIIDEVHMLTREAFNALLKTLEEPPTHALFILATTEMHKLPDTIVSRCVSLTFSKATASEIARSLGRIVTGEKLTIDPDVLLNIAEQADGSFRDAAKLLEQLVGESGSRITKETATQITGHYEVEKFLTLVIARNAKEALILLESEEKKGSDFQEFTKRTLDTIHAEFLARFRDEKPQGVFEKVSTGQLRSLLAIFSKTFSEMKTSYIEQLPLELAVIEWTEKR